MSASLEVATEREGKSSWIFMIRRCGETATHCEITLSWSDYDWWSPSGSHAPSQVALAVAQVASSHPLDNGVIRGVPIRFDASSIRRRISDADALVTEILSRV
ncbi:MAG: hypothetical protein EXS15_06055 [Phycisphaerales bacterium]|nr:hypothetical protein [Phycisphaerales bacterium]